MESNRDLIEMSFDTFLAPLRNLVAESGIAEDEVNQILQNAIDETRSEKNEEREGLTVSQ